MLMIIKNIVIIGILNTYNRNTLKIFYLKKGNKIHNKIDNKIYNHL